MLLLTHKELTTQHRQALTQLLADAGGVAHLAKMLNISYTTVKGWDTRKRISKQGSVLVASHMALGEYHTAKVLRPDITAEEINQINEQLK